MIGFIRGKLVAKQPPMILVDVNGIGYEIQTSMTSLYQLPHIDENNKNPEIFLYTHLQIREDAHQLFGFTQDDERQLFRHLIKVNGVGPKSALAILSGIEPAVFVQHVLGNNISALVRLPGIGKKTAERLVIEMADKLADWSGADNTETVDNQTQSSTHQAKTEAIDALVSLGYSQTEATKIIKKVAEPGASCETLIRLALQNAVMV